MMKPPSEASLYAELEDMLHRHAGDMGEEESGGAPAGAALVVDVKPEGDGDMGGEKVCPHCGKAY